MVLHLLLNLSLLGIFRILTVFSVLEILTARRWIRRAHRASLFGTLAFLKLLNPFLDGQKLLLHLLVDLREVEAFFNVNFLVLLGLFFGFLRILQFFLVLGLDQLNLFFQRRNRRFELHY